MKDLTPINADHKPRPIACDDHRDESARTRPAGHDHDAIYEFGPYVGRYVVIIGTTAQPQALEHDGTGAWCKCGGHAGSSTKYAYGRSTPYSVPNAFSVCCSVCDPTGPELHSSQSRSRRFLRVEVPRSRSSRIMSGCVFQDKWKWDKRYSLWIDSDPTCRGKASCKLCHKSIDLGRMGERALTSHAKGVKHSQLVEAATSPSLKQHFRSLGSGPATSASSPREQSSTTGSAAANPAPVEHTGNAHLKAETLWAMNVVAKNYSFKSCEGSNELFQKMFPDSVIAKQFRCGERKASYMVAFGIAPSFSDSCVTVCGARAITFSFSTRA